MRMKRLRQTLVLLLAVCMMLAGTPFGALAGMMDMTNFNDGRIEVTKVPKGKAGGKVTIRMKIVNDEDSDMEDTAITLVGGTRYDDILNNVFDQEEDDDDEDDSNTIRDYNTQFPFEADSSTFEDKKVGTIRGHSSKTVSMTFQLRRDLQPGYYQAFFDLNSSRDHEKTVGVNIWVSASDGSESDEETMDYDITIGENQSTPYGAYGEVLNFGVNLRNSGNRKLYDVRVSMQLDAAVEKFPFDINDGNYDRKMGDIENFGVNLRNSGNRKLYDVRVSMQLDAAVEKFPFDINDGNYDRKMGDIDVNQMISVPYSMAVRGDAKSGFYPITYKISYKETEDGDFEEPVDKILYVRVKGEDDDDLEADAGDNERTKARIIVESFSTEPAEVYAGTPFVLKIRMKNASSDVQASNILFTFSSEDTDKNPVFTTESGSSTVVVNSLAPGQSTDLELLFNSSPTAEQKSYTMSIKEKYDSPEFKNAEEEVKISIPVKQQPRFSTSTIEVMPESIRSYTMSIKEKYDSPEFKNAEEEVKISIPVKQQPRFSTSTIEVMPESISVGSETNVMFGINNTGKVLLYNVTAVFEGDSIQKTDAYVGNIEPGKTGNVDAMISGIAPTADDGKIKILISYEDENGEVTEVEKEMTLFVTEPVEEMPDMDAMAGMEEMMPEEPSAFSKYKWLILIGAAAAAGTVIYRRRKAKKQAEEEVDIDDEIS